MSICMDKLRNRYVIGTHVMWFEIEMCIRLHKGYGESIRNCREQGERNN